MDENLKEAKKGVLFAVSAYVIWGIAPIYFKALSEVSAFEILCHRIIWSFVFLAIVLYFSKGGALLKQTLTSRKKVLYLLVTSIVIGVNWLVFIWAISNDHLLDASLGYFINPLVNVLLGMIFLNERLRKLQWAAVTFAAIGVVVQIVIFGSIPLVATLLAGSFGAYGLLRKKVNVDAFTGLFIETLVLLPIALIYLILFSQTQTSNLFNNTWTLNILLVSAGIITTVPLLFFTGAATRLRLGTLGFIQYIGPSLMFLLAVLVYDEPFATNDLITFIFIWTALVLFSWDGLANNRQNKRSVVANQK